MKKLFTAYLILLSLAAFPQFPPDLYGEALRNTIGFWENKGQIKTTNEQVAWDVKYTSAGVLPQMFFRRKSKISFVLAERDTSVAVPATLHRLDMSCIGPNAREVDPTAYLVKSYHDNFFLPWTGMNGAVQVRGYSRLVYVDIYPGIDLHFYSGPWGQKMAFECHPGSNPSDITLLFEGHNAMELDVLGGLKLLFADRWVRLPQAIAFQYDQSLQITQMAWTASYQADTALSISNFNFSNYDPTKPLVLQIGPPPAMGGGDPIETPGLCWSTYFGGDQRDVITSSTQDASGNYFVTGNTGSGFVEFPDAPGTQSYGNTGGNFAFVVKMNVQDQMVWRAFLGGQGGEFTTATAVVTKQLPQPAVYIAGHTTSPSLSTAQNGTAYYDGSNSNSTFKGFVASFDNSSGPNAGQRIWTTYFGEEDLQIHGMASDANDRLFITGQVEGSLPDTQDPPPSGAEDYPYGGELDAFIAMFNTSDRLQWRTYYGGSGPDKAKEVVVGSSKVVIAGDTESPNMITVDGGANAWDRSFSGEIREAFVAEFNMNGVQQWGTCFAADLHPSYSIMDMYGKGLALDPLTGDVVIGGTVFSIGLPIVQGPGWYDDQALQGVMNGFLARFSSMDRSLSWSTYLAGNEMNDIRVLYFDAIGNLYVAGRTRDLSFPLKDLDDMFYNNVIQTDVFFFDPDQQILQPEASDMFIMSFTPDHYLAWATYFGGEAGPNHEGIFTLLRRNGDIYAGGFTSKHSLFHFNGVILSSYFPLHDPQVPGVHFQEYYGDVPPATTDAFITRFCASPLTTVSENAEQSSGLSAWLTNGSIIIRGLPVGQHRVMVYDAAGRMVATEFIVSDGQRANLHWREWGDGIYVLHAEGLNAWVRLAFIR